MERISRPFNGKNYWKKKGYSLLDGAGTTKRNMQVVKISGEGNNELTTTKKLRRFWRIKRAPKLNIKKAILSPKKLWNKFKNGYVNLMLRMAGDVGQVNGGGEFEKKRIPGARQVQVKYKSKDEFEARLVLEIYKALSTSKGLSEVV